MLVALAACGGSDPKPKTLADYCPTACTEVTQPSQGCYQQTGPYCQVTADPANEVPSCEDLVKTERPAGVDDPRNLKDILCRIGYPDGCVIDRYSTSCP